MAEEVGSLRVAVALDTVSFNQGIASMSKKMQILGADFKNASGGLDKVGDASKISALKIAELTGKIDLQKGIVEKFRQAHKDAAEQFGEGSKKALDYELKLKRAEGTLQGMERQLTNTSQQLAIQSSRWTTLGNAMQSASDKMKSIGAGMKNAGQTLSMAVTAPILAAGVASAKLASDLAENMNKVDVAFGKNSGEVKSWSDTTLKSFGISQGSALEMASLFGDMGTAMGQSTTEASKMSTGLVGLAGDLASFKNIGIDQAQDALKGIFTGEGESLKSLGIIMQDSTLIAYAQATGQKKAYSEMTQAEKVALRYAFVMNATKNSQGDFSRTSEGAANQSRIFSETMKELGANMGQYLLPVVTPLIAKLSEMAKAFGDLSPATQKTILVIAGIVAVVGPVLVVIGSIVTAVGAIAGAFGAASLAISTAGGIIAFVVGIITSPITLTIAAIAALAAIAFVVVKNWEPIKAFFSNLWTSITTTTSAAWEGIKAFFMQIPGAVSNFLGAAVAKITEFGSNIISWVTTEIPLFVNSFMAFMGELPGKIGYALGFAIGTIIKFGIDAVNWVMTEVPKIINNIVTFFSELPGKIGTLLSGVLTKISEWGGNAINWVVTEVPKFISRIINFYAELPGKIATQLSNALASLRTWASNMITTVATEVPKIVSNIVSFFSGLPGKMLDVGGDIVRGIWDGISNMVGWLGNKVRDFAGGILRGMKDAIDGHSPSRLFRDEVGMSIGAGVAVGIDESINGVKAAMSRMNRSLVAEATMGVKYNALPNVTGISQDMVLKTAQEVARSVLASSGGGGQNINITMPGMVIREEADIDKISEALAFKVRQTGMSTGRVAW